MTSSHNKTQLVTSETHCTKDYGQLGSGSERMHGHPPESPQTTCSFLNSSRPSPFQWNRSQPATIKVRFSMVKTKQRAKAQTHTQHEIAHGALKPRQTMCVKTTTQSIQNTQVLKGKTRNRTPTYKILSGRVVTQPLLQQSPTAVRSPPAQPQAGALRLTH